ncbi:MAG: hypothetical protein VZR23_09070, partial [Lachnospiraceae bacterium]|nr:hypothetical protein [Lachnospiraceae bacterium]
LFHWLLSARTTKKASKNTFFLILEAFSLASVRSHHQKSLQKHLFLRFGGFFTGFCPLAPLYKASKNTFFLILEAFSLASARSHR